MTLYFLDDVFRLNLALKATEGALYGLAFLQSNFCQTHTSIARTISDLIRLIRAYSLCGAL